MNPEYQQHSYNLLIDHVQEVEDGVTKACNHELL